MLLLKVSISPTPLLRKIFYYNDNVAMVRSPTPNKRQHWIFAIEHPVGCLPSIAGRYYANPPLQQEQQDELDRQVFYLKRYAVQLFSLEQQHPNLQMQVL